MLYMATGELAHLGCKFLSDVSVVNSPIVVELLVITVLFCVVLPAKFQQDATIAFLFSAMALLYMFRVTVSPIIRSTYAVYGHR